MSQVDRRDQNIPFTDGSRTFQKVNARLSELESPRQRIRAALGIAVAGMGEVSRAVGVYTPAEIEEADLGRGVKTTIIGIERAVDASAKVVAKTLERRVAEISRSVFGDLIAMRKEAREWREQRMR